MKLTFYLFNESVQDFDDALDRTKLEGEDGFTEIGLVEGLPFEAKAFFQQNRRTQPKWLGFIKDYVQIENEEIFNTTNSFLLLIRSEDRIFAITQGFGFTAINRKKLERGFGLRVVLNEIDPQKIKSIDARNIDTTTKQKKVYINRNSPLYEFDFDFDEDLVSIVSGQPGDAALARKLMGSDSLSLTADIDFLTLGEKCSQLLTAFNRDIYRQNFSFIDYLRVVKDDELISELENILKDNLNNRLHERLILAYPEIPDFEQIEHFRIWRGRDGINIEDVDLTSLYNFLDRLTLDCDTENIHLIGLNSNNDAVTKKFSLHDFIVFEVVFHEKRYLLSLNQWFELADDYVDKINQELTNILEADPGFLQTLRAGDREDTYNSAVAGDRADIVLLDKHNYQVEREGQSKVEVCDLLTQNREFICVKKYNGSSTLSHLFNQGSVSATLLNDEPRYRRFIVNECRAKFPEPIISETALEKENITFVFAIATDTPGPLAENLPFFSKVNLVKTNKVIKRMGFNVKIYKIEIVH